MIRFLPVVLELALLIYCLVDCIQTHESRVRNLPKFGWIALIIIVPIVGGVSWLVAGRPRDGVPGRGGFGPRMAQPGGSGVGRRQTGRPLAPEDDPNFMRHLDRGDPEKERLLQQWEADLKRREEQLRPPANGGKATPDVGPPSPGVDQPPRPDDAPRDASD